VKRKKTLRSTLVFTLFLLLFTSCVNDPSTYAVMQPIQKEGWQLQDPYTCKVVINDTISLYRLDITGRLHYAFARDSLLLVLQVTAPSQRSFSDTLSFAVAHMSHRLWNDFRLPYNNRIRFAEKGEWQFSFWQHTDLQMLTGVKAIGIYITKE